MKFMQHYKKLSDQQKLKFLDAIIIENLELQESLMRYFKTATQAKVSLTVEEFLKIVSGTASDYKARFEKVDLENPDWDDYTPSHTGYMKSWEKDIEASEQAFERIFDQFKSIATDMVISQSIGELTAMLIGLYLAAERAEVYDPWDTFDTANDHLKEQHFSTMAYITDKIQRAVIGNHTVIYTTGLFFKYIAGSDTDHKPDVSFFEDYLMALAGKSAQPEELMARLDESGVQRDELPRLALLLTEMTGEPEDWLRMAQAYYKTNDEIARQLLEYYHAHDQQRFLVLANELFHLKQHHWAPVLSTMISSQLSRELYVKVNWRLVADQHDLTIYERVRPYLSQADKNRLLKKIQWNKPFKVQILAAEERYEEIRQMVENNDYGWDYGSLIRPILGVYPEFCFENIRQKAKKTISTQRGRSVYQQIVEWLRMAYTIEGFQPQSRMLALELYNHKPSLPALKDELRKAGLV
jgi:hypothetical protein